MHIKKAILPIAGKGSRIAPISNFIPKEMLPILSRPLIHYAIAEGIEAGIEEFILVTRPAKHAIADYIDATFGDSGCTFTYINQVHQNGLGGAILCAKHLVNTEDVFAVILPDDMILNKSCLNKMIENYHGGNMTAVNIVSHDDAKKYGIFDFARQNGQCITAKGIIEKPQHVNSNENYAVVGRYILRSSIMNELLHTAPGVGGEVQISDAITNMVARGVKLYGYEFAGKKIDCGNQQGWLQAILNIAMQDKDLVGIIKNFMKDLTC